jgi:hypothetical protein
MTSYIVDGVNKIMASEFKATDDFKPVYGVEAEDSGIGNDEIKWDGDMCVINKPLHEVKITFPSDTTQLSKLLDVLFNGEIRFNLTDERIKELEKFTTVEKV